MDIKFSVMYLVLLCTSCLAFEMNRSAVPFTKIMKKAWREFCYSLWICTNRGTNIYVYIMADYTIIPISHEADCMQKVKVH